MAMNIKRETYLSKYGFSTHIKSHDNRLHCKQQDIAEDLTVAKRCNKGTFESNTRTKYGNHAKSHSEVIDYSQHPLDLSMKSMRSMRSMKYCRTSPMELLHNKGYPKPDDLTKPTAKALQRSTESSNSTLFTLDSQLIPLDLRYVPKSEQCRQLNDEEFWRLLTIQCQQQSIDEESQQKAASQQAARESLEGIDLSISPDIITSLQLEQLAQRCQPVSLTNRLTFEFPSELDKYTLQQTLNCKPCGDNTAQIRNHQQNTNLNICLQKDLPNQQPVKLYNCYMCCRSYKQARDYRAHVATHKNGSVFKCDICSAIMSRATDYLQHLKGHRQKDLHSCECCGRYFRDSCTLATHMRTHTGEKPYKCELCGKMFRQSGTYRRHKKVHK